MLKKKVIETLEKGTKGRGEKFEGITEHPQRGEVKLAIIVHRRWGRGKKKFQGDQKKGIGTSLAGKKLSGSSRLSHCGMRNELRRGNLKTKKGKKNRGLEATASETHREDRTKERDVKSIVMPSSWGKKRGGSASREKGRTV